MELKIAPLASVERAAVLLTVGGVRNSSATHQQSELARSVCEASRLLLVTEHEIYALLHWNSATLRGYRSPVALTFTQWCHSAQWATVGQRQHHAEISHNPEPSVLRGPSSPSF